MNTRDLKSLIEENLALKREHAEEAHNCAETVVETLQAEGYQRFLNEYHHIRFHKFGELFMGWGSLN